MKKVIVFVIMLELFLLAHAFSEQLFDSMNDSELKAAYESLIDEMGERGLLASGVLGTGQYIVGVDLAEGTYNVSSAEVTSYYFVFPTKESYDQYNQLKAVLNLTINFT